MPPEAKLKAELIWGARLGIALGVGSIVLACKLGSKAGEKCALEHFFE